MTAILILAYALGGVVGVVAAYGITTLGRGRRIVSGPLALLCLAALVLVIPAETAAENFAEGVFVGGGIVSGWRFISPQSWQKH
jgi:hypothetical protein